MKFIAAAVAAIVMFAHIITAAPSGVDGQKQAHEAGKPLDKQKQAHVAWKPQSPDKPQSQAGKPQSLDIQKQAYLAGQQVDNPAVAFGAQGVLGTGF